MDNITHILGKNIRELRKQKGWTQEVLAEKSGISVPFMTQIELGKKSASLEVVESIAYALTVPYSRLFKDDNPSTKTEFENQLVSSLQNIIHEKIKELD
ncbi:MAG: helix-turn-helix domain-containing protein [Treponema sp.]|nr:helix-turn-helix domain-containing protein [Treponema sp.]